MKRSQLVAFLRILILSVFPIAVYAQVPRLPSAQEDYTFSYSILEVEPNNIELLEPARNQLLSDASSNGGIVYATWVAADKPSDAPFAGLSSNQMGLMLAWSNDALEQAEKFKMELQSIDNVSMVSSRLFKAVYLPAGLEVPTKSGFYIHREERYSLEDVNDAVRLSQEAWVTWEPYWKALVVGLFREIGSSTETVNLNRIAWYSSYEAWLETRNFTEDMESWTRFKERGSLRTPGSGIAIATDRSVP
tara:strand:+ start:5826 stop:6569 length:744 start_codon:yes stop_codon:yes gene_type:complete